MNRVTENVHSNSTNENRSTKGSQVTFAVAW